MEDNAAENIIKVVALLTAILSGQEEEAHQLVIESDVIVLFSVLTGLLLSSMTSLAEINDLTVQDYLQQLGYSAARSL